MPRKPYNDVSADEIRQALTASCGLMSVAARRLGMTRRRLRARLDTDPALQDAVHDAEAEMVELAEFTRRENAMNGKGVVAFLKSMGWPHFQREQKPVLSGRLTEEEYVRFLATGKLPEPGKAERSR